MSRGNGADKVAQICATQGFRIARTTKGWKVYGKDGVSVAVFHRTPSDVRAIKNRDASLKRLGVRL